MCWAGDDHGRPSATQKSGGAQQHPQVRPFIVPDGQQHESDSSSEEGDNDAESLVEGTGWDGTLSELEDDTGDGEGTSGLHDDDSEKEEEDGKEEQNQQQVLEVGVYAGGKKGKPWEQYRPL